MASPSFRVSELNIGRLLIVSSAIFLLTVPLTAFAQSFVSGFSSKEALQPGMVVAVSKDSKTSVELVPGSEDWRIYGVVIDPADATAVVAEEGQNTFVATNGRYPVLVT